MNDNEIFATWFDNVVGRRLYYRGLIGFFMKRKRENKKLPYKKHSRKMDAEVKKIYQNIMKGKLDLKDDDKAEKNICLCFKYLK